MTSPLWGIGTGVAGGAATGAAFGPIGAAIGGGLGGILGGVQSLVASQDNAKRKAQALKMARIMAMRNHAAQNGGDTQVLDALLAKQGIDQQYREPAPDYGGLLMQSAQAAGNIRQNAKAKQMEDLLADRLNQQESDAFNSQLIGRGRMNGRLDF